MTAPSRWRRDRRPLILGHRGASALVTENTLDAFARAIADGADGVELDVRLCRGGELVVFHDDDLRRLAGRPERIDAMSLAEVAAIELSSGGGISTLEAVLAALPAPALINVEIKSPGAGRAIATTERAIAVVRAAGATDRVLVSSFDPTAVLHARVRAPEIACGLLFHHEMALPLREAWAARMIRPFAVHPDHTLVDARRMRAWRGLGLAVNVWTVDDPAELRRLDALGVDAIITNHPAAACAALAAR